jgi:hypothetical protein
MPGPDEPEGLMSGGGGQRFTRIHEPSPHRCGQPAVVTVVAAVMIVRAI